MWLRIMESGGNLLVNARRRQELIEIVITDTGTEISSENIDRIFQPLYSDKSHGTGLGLSICRDIIDNHHGSISVNSKTGSGTSFTVQIPIAIQDDPGSAVRAGGVWVGATIIQSVEAIDTPGTSPSPESVQTPLTPPPHSPDG